MVKVLENQIVDLDVLPGTKEEELKAQADKISFAAPPSLHPLRLHFHPADEHLLYSGSKAPRTCPPKPAKQSSLSPKAPQALAKMRSTPLVVA